MYTDRKIWLAQSDKNLFLLPSMANRHGLIAGATGTGKTITMKVMAESFSDMGVPVFLADVKGDLSGMCRPGQDSEDMRQRVERFGIEGFTYQKYPTRFWDIFGENGIPVRVTVSSMGPTLLARLLGGAAAVENPGYPRARRVLENNGVSCCCLPVDADGLSIEALSRSGAAVCYVTPSHQFPTGATMPAGRRAELLHWASRRPGEHYIIEDDYDSEFRFDTRPLPSLQGMAGADGPVVYLSTCSRSLAPGIRIAYMVLPRQLLGAWQEKYRLYSGTVGRFEQQTLARFITGGYFTRHLARERTAYKARRDALAAALRASFAPEELTLAGLHTGLHLLAQLKDPPPDAALRAAARQYGVRCSLLSDYDLTGTAHSAAGTLVLGYGSLPDADCAAAGERLKKLCTAAREASDTV